VSRPEPPLRSDNFAFLAAHDPELDRLGADAERFFARDPDVSVVRLRQLGEQLAQRAAARGGVPTSPKEKQYELLCRLEDRGQLPAQASQLFHTLRQVGNTAAHQLQGTHWQALDLLRTARELAVWFHATFGADPAFRAGPFVSPPDPLALKNADAAQARAQREVRDELDRLRKESAAQRTAAEQARVDAFEQARRLLTAEERAQREAEDHAAALALAEETEAQNIALATDAARLQAELEAIRARAAAAPKAEVDALIARARAASARIVLDESATRQLIDAQLRDAGWEVDSRLVTYKLGARPQKGKNLAIAEWPTSKGPADYVLFAGLAPVGVVEAKRENKDVAGSIEQAKRYSRGYQLSGEEIAAGGPWGDFAVPFLFATNGRPYLRQLVDKSGIWFLDGRRPQNHAGALDGWHTPEGLLGMLKQDIDAAGAALAAEDFTALGFLRPYQIEAIRAVEGAIEKGRRECLLAMATGTGKTKTCIALVYRLIKTNRFRRILFLVDRSALGDQAHGAFESTVLEGLLPFSKIFGLNELKKTQTTSDTRVQLATVQAMVKRLSSDTGAPPVDQYDCVIVDECHRGYLLDRELGDAELTFRDEDDYISAYRRVLDHFDAVKIGLTATPALHTTTIFGAPVFTYSYRAAVADNFLVDFENPISVVTKLARDGIHWEAGSERVVLDRSTSVTHTETLPDEVSIEIESFNRKVITEPFNQAVCAELARQIDPNLPAKTVIFCVDNDHADIVVRVLKKALEDRYGEVDDDAVKKITGAADKPGQLILHFRNESLPRFAVTVDLLTTGIDVPAISNIVFLRRVKSRILYEQMLGRATRLCPEIGKESFRVFDAVDLYRELAKKSDMVPVAVNPHIPFDQLVGEILTVEDDTVRAGLVEQLVLKLNRKKRLLKGESLEGFEALAGLAPAELTRKLREDAPAEIARWLHDHAGLGRYLDSVTAGPRLVPISDQPDEVVSVAHIFGEHLKPGDYLAEFSEFLKNNMNTIPALLVVTQRPRELTRKQLRQVKLALDEAGYGERALRTAWREMTNQDIAASIVGHIRSAALGSALLPYSERVDRAMKKILGSRAWSSPERDWLSKIAAQLKVETVVDRDAFEEGLFKTSGGFARIDRAFDGKLGAVLDEVNDAIWQDVA
jgi:type I restriction enzyme R subunit